MKTKKDFQKLNFNEYAFFKGCTTTEAKFEFANILFPTGWMDVDPEQPMFGKSNKYVNDSGTPKIKTSDTVSRDSLDFSMRSNSLLDGESQLDYLCDYYNKGLSIQKLREHSQNKTFRKAMKFTGKNDVINHILKPEQLLKLQKTWILKNCYGIKSYSDNTIVFITNNDWAMTYLSENGIPESKIEGQILEYKERKAPKKKSTGYSFQTN